MLSFCISAVSVRPSFLQGFGPGVNLWNQYGLAFQEVGRGNATRDAATRDAATQDAARNTVTAVVDSRVDAVVDSLVDNVETGAECSSAEQAFEQHFSMVWRGLRRLGVVEAALDDATQDVFLVLHRRWDDFQKQSSLKTWIYGIVMRVASDHTRRARRDSSRFSSVELELASTLATPDQLYQQREAGLLLHRSLERLPEAERQILVLVDLEEQSVVEAAEAMGVKVNTAYTRLRRARKSFEKAIVAEQASSNQRRSELS